jgi:3-isopropylmalate/(R)-2-methylmalate dehydratase small subunit
LQEYGFRVVIAPSFADIFFGNCFKNGVLPIALDAEIVDELFAQVAEGLQLRVDLAAQTVTVVGSDSVFEFHVDSALKQKMLSGMDDIDMTLAERALIEDFEAQHRQRQPWLFRD